MAQKYLSSLKVEPEYHKMDVTFKYGMLFSEWAAWQSLGAYVWNILLTLGRQTDKTFSSLK